TATPHPPKAVSPNAMATAAPRAAPAETPTTPGSASGLPKIACMTAPATASVAPTRTLITTRGKRTCSSVCSMIESSGRHEVSMPLPCSSEPAPSRPLTGSCPTVAETNVPHSSTRVKPTRTAVRRPALTTRGSLLRLRDVDRAAQRLDDARRAGAERQDVAVRHVDEALGPAGGSQGDG